VRSVEVMSGLYIVHRVRYEVSSGRLIIGEGGLGQVSGD
jgi:hypothetical protein